MDFEKIDLVRQTAYEVHKYFGIGFLEKVYENALANRLRKLHFEVQQQHPISVFDEDGTVVGEYFADLLIDNEIIVELKAAKNLSAEHEAQIFNYLKATKTKHGLLINFGSTKFQIKKFAL